MGILALSGTVLAIVRQAECGETRQRSGSDGTFGPRPTPNPLAAVAFPHLWFTVVGMIRRAPTVSLSRNKPSEIPRYHSLWACACSGGCCGVEENQSGLHCARL